MKPVKFKELAIGALFSIYGEWRRKGLWASRGTERVLVKPKDRTVLKKDSATVSSSKAGKDVILNQDDLVVPFQKRVIPR